MTRQGEPVVRAAGVRKTYGPLVAVDDVDLEILEGEVVALLGPNGAGKTTLVEMLEGYRQRDSGSLSVLGMDPAHRERALRERIGVVLQEAGFEEQFTVAELVRLQAGYYPAPRPVAEIIELVGLQEKASAKVKTLSGGQRRRLDLALGVVGDPAVLFLDEPTTGFDPSARRQAWSLVEQVRALGTTILLTTHYLDEAEHLADRVVVVQAGRVVAQGTPQSLAVDSGATTVVSFRLPAGWGVGDLPDVGSTVHAVGGQVEVRTPTPTAAVHALSAWALERSTELGELQLRRPSLEDVYLQLVGDPAS